MSESLLEVMKELERFAAYEGPWKGLRDEAPLLRERVAELRDRENRLDDVLVVALIGGSGVGKSTLLNAIAGDQIAETSEMRPCTAVPVVYHPPGAQLDFGDWTRVPRSALENLILIDTPDSDTIVHRHRELADLVLAQCDLILLCASPEKYLDEATWSLLRPLQGQRTIVCIETKSQGAESIRDHWLMRLREERFQVADYFRVNALHTLDRKLPGDSPAGEEYDFPRFEAFLRRELTRERIARIKRSNVAGLLAKAVCQLDARAQAAYPAIQSIAQQVDEANKAIARETLENVRSRIFAAAHLWAYAFGREAGLRSKGLMGALFRIFETLRSLPARLPGMLPWGGQQRKGGRQAAALLLNQALFDENIRMASDAILNGYNARQSEISLALARAGFDPPSEDDGRKTFEEELNQRLVDVIRGPARNRIIRGAHILTSWPLTILADAPPLAFIAYAGYTIVRAYFEQPLLNASFFIHTATLLCMLIGVELFFMFMGARFLAWMARRNSLHDLRATLYGPGLALQPERRLIQTISQEIQTIARLKRTVIGNGEADETV